MKIRILSETSFQITEQSDKYLDTYEYHFDRGIIEVAKSCYPEVRDQGFRIMVFVRGMYTHKNDSILRADVQDMPHIIEALKRFCRFNEESFEIEPCIL